MQTELFEQKNDIEQAKLEVMNEALDKGCSCPVCDQFVKVYKRTINSTMARQLITAYQKYGTTKYFHASEVVIGMGAGDFSKLRFWGLIEEKPHDPNDKTKKNSGIWRVTLRGSDYVCSGFKIPKYAIIYNSKLLEVEGESANIVDALGKKFNYREVMQSAKY